MRFAQPHMFWLLAVTLAALSWFLLWAWRRKQQLVRLFVQERLLPQLTVGVSPARQKFRYALLLAAITLAFVALARPQWGFKWEETHQRGLDIAVAIDTSRSMLAEDVRPSRLARAKLAALDLMKLAKSDRLALIAFAGSAYLQCPLTLDDEAFRQNVDALDTRIIPQGGTALAQAIDCALAAYSNDDRNFKILVLITDGEDHDPGALAAAERAAKAGLRIFTLGAGTPAGEILRQIGDTGAPAYIKDREGNAVMSRLNEPLLQQIATTTGGFYLPLRSGNVVETLYQKGLAPLPKSEFSSRFVQLYHERFPWPLGLALLLLLAELLIPEHRRSLPADRPASPPRSPVASATLIGLLLTPLVAQASSSSALRQYEKGHFSEAAREFQSLQKQHPDDPALSYNVGTATYRLGQFEAAARAFSNALHAVDLSLQQRAYYNLGNALYREGEKSGDLNQKATRWESAAQSLTSATKLNPQDADAAHNLEFVKRKLEELRKQMPKQPQQNQDSKDQKDKEDKNDQQDQKGQQNQQDRDKQQKSDPSKDSSKQDSESQPKPDKDPNKPDSQSSQPKPDKQEPSSQDQPKASQPSPAKEPDSKPGADSSKPSEDRQANAGSPGQEPKGEPGSAADTAANAVPAGQMTPQQAQQLLEAQKGNERILMFVPKPPDSAQPRSFKDW